MEKILGMAVFLICLNSAAPAWAGRRILTTTTTLSVDDIQGYSTYGVTRGFLTRIWVEMVNLSTTSSQTVHVRVLSFTDSATLGFVDAPTAAAALPSWTTNVTYTNLKSRTGTLSDTFIGSQTVVIPANGKGTAAWSISCKSVDAAFPTPCFLDESLWAGYTAPYTNLWGRSDVSLRFEITVDEDRGALLSAYTVEHILTGSNTNPPSTFINREINGGRPF